MRNAQPLDVVVVGLVEVDVVGPPGAVSLPRHP